MFKQSTKKKLTITWRLLSYKSMICRLLGPGHWAALESILLEQLRDETIRKNGRLNDRYTTEDGFRMFTYEYLGQLSGISRSQLKDKILPDLGAEWGILRKRSKVFTEGYKYPPTYYRVEVNTLEYLCQLWEIVDVDGRLSRKALQAKMEEAVYIGLEHLKGPESGTFKASKGAGIRSLKGPESGPNIEVIHNIENSKLPTGRAEAAPDKNLEEILASLAPAHPELSRLRLAGSELEKLANDGLLIPGFFQATLAEVGQWVDGDVIVPAMRVALMDTQWQREYLEDYRKGAIRAVMENLRGGEGLQELGDFAEDLQEQESNSNERQAE